MKLHHFASKRSLTNFCCLLICLALIKLSFAIFYMAGGKISSLTAEKKEISPKASIIARNHQEQQKGFGQDINGKVENTTLHSGTKVSFLPKTQETKIPQVQENNLNSQEMTKQNTVADLFSPHKKNINHASAEQEMMAELNNDMILASVSSSVINQNKSNERMNLLYEGLEKNENLDLSIDPLSDNQKELEDEKIAESKISLSKLFSSSLFSLVGVAHAKEVEDYVRPDQQTDYTAPPPKVNPYVSPDSLKYKESELLRKEEELMMLRQQMDLRMDDLNKLEGKIEGMVNDVTDNQNQKYQHLINTYTNMKARNAAQALSTLDEKIAVQILSGMKSQQAGEIFSYMEPMHAARLSEAMTKLSAE